MEETRQIHPALRWAGWIALFLGLAIPLGNSLAAMVIFRDPSCGSAQWSFAPLVASCEPVTAGVTAYGWFGTALVLALLATAIAITTVETTRIGALRGFERTDAIHFGITVVVVVTLAAVGLSLQLDPSRPINAWVFFASAGGMTVYILSLLFLLFRLAAQHRF